MRAIRFAEVVVIVFDATTPFEKQDLQIADLVIREGRVPLIAFNKWDLIENSQATLVDLHEKCIRLLPQVRGLRAVPLSGQYGQGIDKLMENVMMMHRVWNRRISTGKLNRWLETIVAHHPPPAVLGVDLRSNMSHRLRHVLLDLCFLARDQSSCLNRIYVIFLMNCVIRLICLGYQFAYHYGHLIIPLQRVPKEIITLYFFKVYEICI